MNSIELLEDLINLHIANKDRVAALQEGADAIKTIENVRDLLTKWRNSIKYIKEEVKDKEGWFLQLAQLEYLTAELQARLEGYVPCPPSCR